LGEARYDRKSNDPAHMLFDTKGFR
jgi:hypothetical protein